ncbi:hypothetical protein ACFX2I_000411 [Malus domestica]
MTALSRPFKAFGVTGIPIPQPRKVVTTAPKSSPFIFVEDASTAATFRGARVMPSPLASIPATASLPELVREFGQIKTKLRSPRCPFEPQVLHRGFKEWMQRDFTASFSLKALQEAEKTLTELYKA